MNRITLLVIGAAVAIVAPARSQVFDPAFVADYSFVDLGTPTGIPGPLGGVTFKLGDPSTLLLGGAANTTNGAVYEIGVQRDPQGHIVAFSGAPTLHSTAPNVDGGLEHGPTGVLFFTGFPIVTLGQIEPGSTVPDKIIDLAALGVNGSPGAIAFVPSGFPGAGRFKILSYTTSLWYDAVLAPDGSGTFDVSNVQLRATLSGGLEGAVYVHSGNPGFAVESTLVCEYSTGKVAVYDLDSNGDPVAATRREFMTGLTGAEGARIDPVTGDFIFSTFGGGDRVLVIRGFTLPTEYCTAKLNSLGCTPQIAYTGLPTVSGPDNFFVTATGVFNHKNGFLYWGLGSANTPFHGGTLCVAAPLQHFPIQNSGGTALPATDCSGTYSEFISQAFLSGHSLTPGTAGYVQYVMRDPGFAPPNNLALTAATRFVVGN